MKVLFDLSFQCCPFVLFAAIVGKDVPNLCLPHRRLVCYCRLYEIRDINRREKVGQHQRDVFLFNDLLLITKTTNRSRNGQLAEYQYRSCCPLDGLQVILFSTTYYAFGIRINRRVDNKIIACFNARNELDQKRFVDDLRESIAEMDEMEQLRITKSSSLVHLNSFTVATEDQTSQQTVINSNATDVTNSFSSMSSINTLPTGGTMSSNGCSIPNSITMAQCMYMPK